MFELSNTNDNMANKLRPIGGPWSFFSRVRILAGGQILEDIDLYNRVHEMFFIILHQKETDIMIMPRALGIYGKVVIL